MIIMQYTRYSLGSMNNWVYNYIIEFARCFIYVHVYVMDAKGPLSQINQVKPRRGRHMNYRYIYAQILSFADRY